MDTTAVDGAPSPGGGSHRHVHWRRPAGKRRPGVIDATRAELVRGLEGRSGPLWFLVCRKVVVAGYPLARALVRIRALRSDGVESLLAMAVALLYLADIRTGFIGKPRDGGGPWQRYTLRDLAQFAFGAQDVASLRRARRALDMMISLGWAFPTKQVRRCVGEDTFRSDPGIRRLNLGVLCAMTSTSWLLKRDRIHADATRGPAAYPIASARRRTHGPASLDDVLAAAGAREAAVDASAPSASVLGQMAALLKQLER